MDLLEKTMDLLEDTMDLLEDTIDLLEDSKDAALPYGEEGESKAYHSEESSYRSF